MKKTTTSNKNLIIKATGSKNRFTKHSREGVPLFNSRSRSKGLDLQKLKASSHSRPTETHRRSYDALFNDDTTNPSSRGDINSSQALKLSKESTIGFNLQATSNLNEASSTSPSAYQSNAPNTPNSNEGVVGWYKTAKKLGVRPSVAKKIIDSYFQKIDGDEDGSLPEEQIQWDSKMWRFYRDVHRHLSCSSAEFQNLPEDVQTQVTYAVVNESYGYFKKYFAGSTFSKNDDKVDVGRTIKDVVGRGIYRCLREWGVYLKKRILTTWSK